MSAEIRPTLVAAFILTVGLSGAFPVQAARAAHAAPSAAAVLQNGLDELRAGHYGRSLEIFDRALSARPSGSANPELVYWSAIDLYSLQKFDQAAERFKRIADQVSGPGIDPQFDSLNYYLGQCEYATRDYPGALAAFQASLARKVEVPASLYYIGYLHALLREDAQAVTTLQTLVDLPTVDQTMRVSGAFELGEVYYAEADAATDSDAKRTLFSRKAIPAYQLASSLDPAGEMAAQARQRVLDTYRKLGQDGPETDGGVPIPEKPWVITFNGDLKYDSNIVNEADNKIIKVTHTGSAYERPSVFARYEYLHDNWIAVSPEAALDWTFNDRRSDPLVFANDSAGLNPALRLRFDRRLWDRAASTLVEYEYGYQLRDYLAQHSLSYYTQSHNLIVGERARPFATGSTTLTANLRFHDFNSALQGQSYTAPGATLSQNWSIWRGYTLSTSFNFESQRAHDSFNDQRSYRFSLASGIPDLPWGLSLDYSLSVLLVDTMNQSATRGLEKNLSPSVSLIRYLDQANHFSVNLNYSFVRNISKDTENYAYSKQVLGLGVGVVF